MEWTMNGIYVFNIVSICMMIILLKRDIDLFGEDEMEIYNQQEDNQLYLKYQYKPLSFKGYGKRLGKRRRKKESEETEIHNQVEEK